MSAAAHTPDLRVGNTAVLPACSRRWVSERGYELGEAARVHAAHVAAFETITVPELTVVDRLEGVRGAVNVIGHGLGIDTTSGPDTAVDRAVRMLERRSDTELHPDADPDGWDPLELAWGISHRNRVPLHRIRHTPATTSPRRAA